MTDRDSLINELKKSKNRCLIHEGGGCLACKYREQADCTLENLADHLLANGVIVPPCKVGQTVYTKYGYSFKIQRIEILEDKKILFRCGNDGTDDYMAFYDFEIGTEVFLTKEEAEAKLKERKEK